MAAKYVFAPILNENTLPLVARSTAEAGGTARNGCRLVASGLRGEREWSMAALMMRDLIEE